MTYLSCFNVAKCLWLLSIREQTYPAIVLNMSADKNQRLLDSSSSKENKDLVYIYQQYRAKHDLSRGSKYFFCIPLNLTSVRGLAAATFIIHLFEAILALACFSLLVNYNLSARVKWYLLTSIWINIGISSTIIVISTVLCFGLYIHIWLLIRGLATTLTILLVPVILGVSWAEFVKNPSSATVNHINSWHMLIFSLWSLVFIIAMMFSNYAWRAVYCKNNFHLKANFLNS
jgi:hypothetical protein